MRQVYAAYPLLQLPAYASILQRVNSASASKSTFPLALWALALGAFGIGMTEFVPVGLLPLMADEFTVSIPIAGWVVTAYALGVMVGAPLMTLLGVRIPRRRMLIVLMALFVVGNVITAAAPQFGAVLAGRVITSFTHGTFFGLGSVVAASLVPPSRRAAAVAFMFTGLTLANVVGVPAGTWIGQTFGWRSTFAVMAVFGLVAAIAVRLLVPVLPQDGRARLGSELRTLARPQVLLAMLMTLFGFGGVFAAVTYLAPLVTGVTGLPDSAMTWILLVLGVGMVAGNLVGGKLADRHLMRTVLLSLVTLVAALIGFALTANWAVPTVVFVFLVGAVGFATVPPLQSRVLQEASGAPTLASTLNIGAFNLGNALAAGLGGAAITATGVTVSAVWVGAGLSAVGLGLALASVALARRTAGRSDQASSGVVETQEPEPVSA